MGGGEGVGKQIFGGKVIPGRKKSKYRCPKAGACFHRPLSGCWCSL